MPLVEIHLLEGRTDEQKKALLSAVTEAVRSSINAPVETIRVWIQEFSPKGYMAAGRWYGDRK
jgi:4-oxalocrotonate tautomerase